MLARCSIPLGRIHAAGTLCAATTATLPRLLYRTPWYAFSVLLHLHQKRAHCCFQSSIPEARPRPMEMDGRVSIRVCVRLSFAISFRFIRHSSSGVFFFPLGNGVPKTTRNGAKARHLILGCVLCVECVCWLCVWHKSHPFHECIINPCS
jgi:hypothetical protein